MKVSVRQRRAAVTDDVHERETPQHLQIYSDHCSTGFMLVDISEGHKTERVQAL